jgi:hypothetical protein
VPKQVCLT